MCACADVLNFKYRDLKMFLLKLGSELQNLIKKIPTNSEDINKIQTAFPRSGMQNYSIIFFERNNCIVIKTHNFLH